MRANIKSIFYICIFLLLIFNSCSFVKKNKEDNTNSIIDRSLKANELIDRGVISLRSKNSNDARMFFMLSYELQPSARALDGIGCAEFAINKYENAIRIFEEVVAKYPNYNNAKSNLALGYMKIGYIKKSINILEELMLLTPENYQIRNNLFAILYNNLSFDQKIKRTEILDKIEEGLRQAKALSPHPVIKENLAKINVMN